MYFVFVLLYFVYPRIGKFQYYVLSLSTKIHEIREKYVNVYAKLIVKYRQILRWIFRGLLNGLYFSKLFLHLTEIWENCDRTNEHAQYKRKCAFKFDWNNDLYERIVEQHGISSLQVQLHNRRRNMNWQRAEKLERNKHNCDLRKKCWKKKPHPKHTHILYA